MRGSGKLAVAPGDASPYLSGMVRIALPLLAALVLPLAAQAQRAQPPHRLGNHQDWVAATHQEGGQKVCYAFTRANGGDGPRRNVTLTVTQRPTGRDQVAISVGQPLPRGAEAVMTVASSGGSEEFKSYGVVQSSAFFANGSGLIAAFRAGREANVRSPGAGGRGTVTDNFSLLGFTAAYEAISRECPAR